MIDPGRTLAAARRLEVATKAGFLLLGGLTAAGAVAAVVSPLSLGEGIASRGGYGDVPLAPWQAWALIAVVAVHAVVWMALLVTARRLFRKLAKGDPGAAVHCARRLAFLLWVMLLWGLISQPLASVAATWGYPDGERSLSVAFGTPQLTVAFSALVASFMAHAFALWSELWRDHREVI